MKQPEAPAPIAFWQRPAWADGRTAILDGRTGDALTYAQLYDCVERGARELRSPRKKLALLCTGNDIDCLMSYLSLLAAGHAVWLWPGDRLSAAGIALIGGYRPDVIVCGPSTGLQLDSAIYHDRGTLFGYELWLRRSPQERIHEDLALLLPTSGSTGNPRLVRLAYSNIAANAAQIVEGLDIHAGQRWLCSLPFHYIFGLSVVNSALAAGATLVLGDKTVMQQAFWQLCVEHGVTSLPVVPSQLRLMRQVGHDHDSIAPIRKIAISGSALEPALHEWLAQKLAAHGVAVYSMYGMTEAAGRIAVLPAAEFTMFPSCVGGAVSGGSLRIRPDGEIEYAGPNVMLGYASTRTCLMEGDQLGGTLRTGDLGNLDASGRLYITGRRNRICKLFGLRVDLDDVEALCAELAPVAAVGDEKAIHLFHTSSAASTTVTACLQQLSSRMRLPIVAFSARQIDAIPKTASGKTHYARLAELIGS